MSKKFLLIQLNPVGDVTKITPVIDYLKSMNNKVYVLVDDGNFEILQLTNNIDKLFVIKRDSLKRTLMEKPYLEIPIIENDILDLINEINSLDINNVINFHFTNMSAFLATLINANDKKGLIFDNDFSMKIKDENSNSLYEDIFKRGLFGYHKKIDNICDYFLNYVYKNRNKAFPINLKLKISEKDKIRDSFIKNHSNLIGIQPGASQTSKLWNEDKWAEFINYIHKETSSSVLINASIVEKELIDSILSKVINKNRVLNNIDMNLVDSIYTISFCNQFISLETGPSHISAALNIPTIVLNGPVNFFATSPYQEDCYIITGKISENKSDITKQINTDDLINLYEYSNNKSKLEINNSSIEIYKSFFNVNFYLDYKKLY